MLQAISLIDDVLRRRPWTTRTAARGRTRALGACVFAFGFLYGMAMGSYSGVGGDRVWLLLYSGLKVPFLLLLTFLIGLPNFFVLNTLFGLRRDFRESLRALLAAQAGVAIVLAACAPLTLLWYASFADYSAAVRFNGLIFALASFAGQHLLRGYYRPLILRNPRHRPLLWAWLGLYVFIGIQMGWIMRPFIGAPGAPVQFFRSGDWGNAYVVVAQLIFGSIKSDAATTWGAAGLILIALVVLYWSVRTTRYGQSWMRAAGITAMALATFAFTITAVEETARMRDAFGLALLYSLLNPLSVVAGSLGAYWLIRASRPATSTARPSSVEVNPAAFPASRPVGVAQLFAGVILPLICLVMSFPDRPDWQSGSPAYAQLLLSYKPSMPLYPFLLYSMTSMVLLFARPARFRENALVRLGIFSGVLLAGEYWLIFQVATPEPCMIPSGQVLLVFVAFLPWGIWQFLSLLGKHRKWIVGGAIFILLVSAAWSPTVIPAVIIACLLCSTPWALASYLVASFRLIRGSEARRQFNSAELLGPVSWFAAHCCAWRVSFIWMLEEYARLPATPAGRCFVCTAVAKGHLRVVHGADYLASDGTVYRVNDQLRALKAFELLLASISPKSHRACRRIYDRVGPRVAAMLFHPVLADVAYFALKPAEWIALLCLGLAIPGKIRLIYDLYSNIPIREAATQSKCDRARARATRPRPKNGV